MSIQILMPAASPTMEEGTLVNWLIKEGDKVLPGDIIVEIETDKSVMEVEALDEGIVGRILVPDGTEDVKVNTVIALLLEDGEDASQLSGVVSETVGGETPVDGASTATGSDNSGTSNTGDAPYKNRILASPAAKRVSAEAGLDLKSITGTGPKGRILKKDALAAAAELQTSSTSSAVDQQYQTSVAVVPLDIPFEETALSNMRKVIAQRLQESKRTIPHFYLTVDIEIDQLLDLQKKLNLHRENGNLTINDFVIRAVAMSLDKVPDANVQFDEEKIIRFKRVDISVAVAVKDGLLTPVIRDAAVKGIAEISQEMRMLAQKARAGKLVPEDYQGGSFTISNLGMYGIRQFDAVINPPQAGIFAIGRGEQRPVVKDNTLTVATMMTVTLSADHRVVDGAIGADLLTTLKGYLEEPYSLMNVVLRS